MPDHAAARFVGDLDTPTLIVDVSRLDANLARMAERIAGTSTDLRPHAKAHKTREVAERQLAHGAAGLTVAKVGEAEAMVAAGFDDILIAYPLVGPVKLRRLVGLLDRARIRFTIDSAVAAESASGILAAAAREIEVLIEVEAGNGRSGVQTLSGVERLAETVAALPGLRLVGVMTFGAGYVIGESAQREVARAEAAIGGEAATRLRDAGHDVTIVTCSSTPTSPYAAEDPAVTEVRAGVYAFYDCKQVSLEAATFDECALTLLSTVVSHPLERRYVLDAGIKALAGEDYGWGTYGRILETPDIVVSWAAEEHGVVNLPDDVPDPGWRIGDRVRIIPNHACGASNMHDELMAIDGERVVERWPIIARGRVR